MLIPSNRCAKRSFHPYHVCGKVVDCDAQGCPAGDHNWEHAKPDGDGRNDDESGSGDGSNNIGPHSRAVHDAHGPAQLGLEQWAVRPIEHDLEVALCKHDCMSSEAPR